MATHKPYLPFPPEYEAALWEGVMIECNKAYNRKKIESREDLRDLKQTVYLYIKTHWQWDPAKSKVTSYIATITRYRIRDWREKKAEEAKRFYGGEGEGIIDNYSRPTFSYDLDFVIERAGFTDFQKQIIEKKLEGKGNEEIAKELCIKRGSITNEMRKIKKILLAFDAEDQEEGGGKV